MSVRTLLESVCVLTGVGAAIVAAHCWALISSRAAAQLIHGDDVLSSLSSERLVTFLLASVVRVACLSRVVSCSQTSLASAGGVYIGAWLQHVVTALFVLLLAYEQLWHVTLVALSISGLPLVLEMLGISRHLESSDSHLVAFIDLPNPLDASTEKVMVDVQTRPWESAMQHLLVRRGAWLVPLTSLVLLRHLSKKWQATSDTVTPARAAAFMAVATVDALWQSISAIRTLIPLDGEQEKASVCLPDPKQSLPILDRVSRVLTQAFASLSLAYSLGMVTLWTLMPVLEEVESVSSGDALRYSRRFMIVSVSVIVVVSLLLLARQAHTTPERSQDKLEMKAFAFDPRCDGEVSDCSALSQDRLFICVVSLLTIATMDWRVAAVRALTSGVSFSRTTSSTHQKRMSVWCVMVSLFETIAPLLAFSIQCHHVETPMDFDAFLCGAMQRGMLSLMNPVASREEEEEEGDISATDDVV
ncbi:hypothetical protein PINS_up010623 [Pythium insidiosum]|nr:hypothetical protein PINS_up010623 [Pythium insidiosum]